MAELDGTPLASFWARLWAFLIDFMLAALTFVPAAVGVAFLLEKLGWLRDDTTIYFDPFNHEHWQSLAYFVMFVAASNYIGNGATIGKRIMKIRAVSLVHERLSLWHSIERALGYGASALEAFFWVLSVLHSLEPKNGTRSDCGDDCDKRAKAAGKGLDAGERG
jgi:uncharacterized RDD family membrane protein YckC